MHSRFAAILSCASVAACFDDTVNECVTDADCCAISEFRLCQPTNLGLECKRSTIRNPLCTGGYCDTTLYPDSVQLTVPALPQSCSEWSWAAAATMVLNYYGVQGNQCLAVDSTGACCAADACQSSCNSTSRPDFVLTYEGFHGIHVDHELTEADLQHEIANGRPVIAHFVDDNSRYVVISGYRTDGSQTLYHVIDPLNWSAPWSPGAGPYVADLPYSTLFYGPGSAYWSSTYLRISPRLDGCSPVGNPTCTCFEP